MRHRRAGRKLGRNAEHRAALFRNLTRALIEHERIITTVAKAKAVRPFVEKLITLAKTNTVHTRRLAVARLHDEDLVAKLFKEIGPRYADRPGGYTRILKRSERRLGDAGPTAYLELLKAGETKAKAARPAPAPAPVVATTPAPQPTPPEQPQQQAAPPAEQPAPQGENQNPPAS